MFSISFEDRQLLDASGLFDAEWYIRTYPDVAMVGMDPLEHFLWLGTVLKRDPSEHFSAVNYLSRNPDVSAAGLNPLLHYVKWGKAEGRIVEPSRSDAIKDSLATDGFVANFGLKLPIPFLYRSPLSSLNVRIGIFARGNLHRIEQAIGFIRSFPVPFSLHVIVASVDERHELHRRLSNWGHGKLAIEVSKDKAESDGAWETFTRTSLEFDYALFMDLDCIRNADDGTFQDELKITTEGPERFWSVLTAFDTDRLLGFLSASPAQTVSASKLDASLSRLASKMGVLLDEHLSVPLSPAIFWARCSALRPLVSAYASADLSAAPCSALSLAYLSGEVDAFRHAILTYPEGERIHLGIQNAETLLAATRQASSLSLPKKAFQNPIDDSDSKTILSAKKARFKKERIAELGAFLEGNHDLQLPTSERPEVSIIVALYNSAELTLPFLKSLTIAMRKIACELILVDNASTDATRTLLRRVHGARVILNNENVHFLRAVNAGAEIARGEHILLLNNDTLVPEDAIGVAAADLTDRSIGAVGGKLILPDGHLQEAGSIVWNDGSCAGFGRNCNPRHPIFQFMRDVDFCSGAFLMLRRDLFEQLGGFDDKYAPAYYEETDLCMRVRAHGLRVVYDPRIAVEHFEFGSASTNQQAVDLQIHNQRIFSESHRSILKRRHFAPNQEIIRAANAGDAPRILYLDDRVPFQEFGSGFPRSREIVLAIHDAGWDITVFPMTFPEADFEKIWQDFPVTIEIAGELGRDGLAAFLEQRRGYYDAIMASRPHNMALLMQSLDLLGGYEHTPIVYDAEAIFVEREAIRRKLLGSPFDEATYQAQLREELSVTEGATIITAVSERERALFQSKTGIPTYSLGHKFPPCPTPAAFAERRDILFVGALTGTAAFSPNVDSLQWFVRNVVPLLDQKIGQGWQLLVAGHVDSNEASSLASNRVSLLGRVPDLTDLFNRAKILIAPTRFAAGIPIKAIEAANRGLPIVSTSLIASQLGFTAGEHLLAADTPELYAQACADLYRNEPLWRSIRGKALLQIERDCSSASFDFAVREILENLIANQDVEHAAVCHG